MTQRISNVQDNGRVGIYWSEWWRHCCCCCCCCCMSVINIIARYTLPTSSPSPPQCYFRPPGFILPLKTRVNATVSTICHHSVTLSLNVTFLQVDLPSWWLVPRCSYSAVHIGDFMNYWASSLLKETGSLASSTIKSRIYTIHSKDMDL